MVVGSSVNCATGCVPQKACECSAAPFWSLGGGRAAGDSACALSACPSCKICVVQDKSDVLRTVCGVEMRRTGP